MNVQYANNPKVPIGQYQSSCRSTCLVNNVWSHQAERLVLIIIFWWPWSITLATTEQPQAGPIPFCGFNPIFHMETYIHFAHMTSRMFQGLMAVGVFFFFVCFVSIVYTEENIITCRRSLVPDSIFTSDIKTDTFVILSKPWGFYPQKDLLSAFYMQPHRNSVGQAKNSHVGIQYANIICLCFPPLRTSWNGRHPVTSSTGVWGVCCWKTQWRGRFKWPTVSWQTARFRQCCAAGSWRLKGL